MKTEVTAGGVIALAGVSVAALALLWLYSKRGVIAEAAQAINPASEKNIAYRAASAATQAATGQKGVSFGSWLYDLTHPNQPDITAPTYPSGGKAWDDITLRKAREAAGMGLADAGWVEALGADGRRELIPPATPATWLAVAGVSAALYAASKAKRRRSRRRVR